MSVARVGSSKEYAEGWEKVFGGGKSPKKKTAKKPTKKVAAKKKSPKKKGTKKKARK